MFTLDISADPQVINAEYGDYGELTSNSDSYTLKLHYQDGLGEMDIPGYSNWCRTRTYTPNPGWQDTQEFNLLESLQAYSDLNQDGLTGKIQGSGDEWGFSFYPILEGQNDKTLCGQYVGGHLELEHRRTAYEILARELPPSGG